MATFLRRNKYLSKISFFFPIQLLLVLAKKNQMILLFWLILFGMISQHLAQRYGVFYLFVSPEYLDRVSFLSYLIMGFSCGGFIMAFNISSYTMNSFRFPFLATLSNPFLKYCLNNSIIPLAFLIVYLIKMYAFLNGEKLYTFFQIWQYITAFLIGNAIFIVLSLSYFSGTNQDIFKMFGVAFNDDAEQTKAKRANRVYLRKDFQWNPVAKGRESRDWHVETYISALNKIKLARGYEHYDKEMLINVYKQNHRNAAIYQLVVISSLLLLGLFSGFAVAMVPAGASILLMFTMFLMFAGAIHTWMRGWSTSFTILVLLLLNFVSNQKWFHSNNKAFGLDYNAKPALYTSEKLRAYDSNHTMREQDIKLAIQTLEKWKAKVIAAAPDHLKKQKPKLLLLNTSGGGMRATIWTCHVLMQLDSISKGTFLNQTALITGSSGGMLGAGYMRELYLRKQLNQLSNLYARHYLDEIGKDLLNPVVFSLTTNDLFFRFQQTRVNGQRVTKDRGLAFEQRLNQNTHYVLDKKVSDYRQFELNAIVPTAVFSPTIANDGRRLLISASPISYLAQNMIRGTVAVNPLEESVEFSRFFKDQKADDLKLTSALRMNATFPYIMPIVNLPSQPTIECMDAGVRDNYGIDLSIKYIFALREWIEANTSGVVIVQIRDKHKQQIIEANPPKRLLENITMPLGSLYSNLFNIQDYTQNNTLQYASLWFNGKIDLIDFELQNQKPDNISLSWHLTNKEKTKIINSFNLPENQQSLKRLLDLMHAQ